MRTSTKPEKSPSDEDNSLLIPGSNVHSTKT